MQLRWQADALDAFLYEPVNNRLRVSHAALLSPLFHPASAELRQANYGGLGAAFMANVLRMYTAPDEEIDADILPEPWANFTSLAAQRARILNCSTELLSNLRDVAALGIAWQALKASNSSRFDGGQSSAGAGLYIADGDSRHYYSGDQLFFLTYCLSRCEEDVRLHRPRGPGCNAAVRGVRDFGSVFQCRKGTPMVPSESCDITQVL
ncbi:hypothetical protein V5799_028717 [Amblyomma americanum]|uniref:Peptidase M13 C-terminal domain-containing protein n=1 Tax=Amblyomma americanum TaxID=6943 RepID=A0AAQ4DC25_AMBAM